MFERLIASQSRSTERGRTRAGVGALVAHGAVVAGAVFGTLRSTDPPRIVTTVPLSWREPQPPHAPTRTTVPAPAAPEVDLSRMPPHVSTALPAINTARLIDATEWLRAPREVVNLSPAGDGEGPRTASLVDEPPLLLAGPRPSYPEALRAAGITGRVLVQAVIDTLGRAEPGMTVVESAHPGFDAPALDYVRRALFRPGRVHGRPVRVLIRLPVDFRLASVQ